MFYGLYSKANAYKQAKHYAVSRNVRTIRNDGSVVTIPASHEVPAKDLAKIKQKARADNG